MNELARLEGLLSQLLSGIQKVVSSGEVLSDDFQGLLAEQLRYLTGKIDNLKNEPPPIEQIDQEEAQVANEVTPPPPPTQPPSGGQIPPLEPAPHESSNINAFKYDDKTGKLFVKFQGKYPSQNGPVYSYQGVPKNIYEVFRRGAVAPKTSGKNAWHTWKEGVTPSHGAAMYALIKEGGYNYQRLS